MSRRISTVLGVAGAMVALSCQGQAVANIELLVRQPDGVGDRTRPDTCNGAEDVCLHLSRSLDGEPAEDASLPNDFRGPTKPLPLAQEAHDLDAELYTGAADAPTLLGRASRVHLPIIDGAGGDVSFVRPVLLAAQGEVEALTTNAPVALANADACADQAGNAWFMGSQVFRLGIANLQPEWIEPFPVPAGDTVSCAAQLELPEGVAALADAREPLLGSYYAFVGDCGGLGGGQLRSGQGNDYREYHVTVGDGCDPQVAVRGNVVWIAQHDTVSVHARDNLVLIDSNPTRDNPVDPRIDAVVLQDGSLLLAGTGGTVTRYWDLETGIRSEVREATEVARFILHDDVAWALTEDHRLINVDEEIWTSDEVSLPTLSAILDADMLSDGTVVALAPEGVGVSGSAEVVPQLAGHNRFALTVTAGDAILLWGGAAGVDVLVPGAPALLSER